jgi:tRNA dimethylallyltransferase
MNTPFFNIITVCGPTASGKTRLAVSLARLFNGEIISADSRQVYRGMDIGTGKDLEEYGFGQNLVPYHCIDIADPAEIYTVHRFKNDCLDAILDIQLRGKMPVLAGGTGLYIEALLKGYDIPEIPEDAILRESLFGLSAVQLDEKLKSLNPDIYAFTDRSSRKRLIRAIEISMHSGGKTHRRMAVQPEIKPVVLCTRWPREELIARIDKRLEARLEHGLVKEVEALFSSEIPRQRFGMFGMEYGHVAQYLEKQVDYGTMVQNLKTAIHRLAKRQMTWFRGMERRGTRVIWIDNADINAAVAAVEAGMH